MIKAPCLKLEGRGFKSHSEHQLVLFLVVPKSAPRPRLKIANWSAFFLPVGIFNHVTIINRRVGKQDSFNLTFPMFYDVQRKRILIGMRCFTVFFFLLTMKSPIREKFNQIFNVIYLQFHPVSHVPRPASRPHAQVLLTLELVTPQPGPLHPQYLLPFYIQHES